MNNPYGHRRAQLGAYVLIVAIAVTGFLSLDNEASRRSAADREHRRELCAAVENNRQQLVGFINFLVDFANASIDPTTPPEKAAKQVARAEIFRSGAIEKLPELPCE